MAKFPTLPATVDCYVREFLNRLASPSGNAGDKAVLHSELAELGLERPAFESACHHCGFYY